MEIARETLWRVLSGKYYLHEAKVISASVRTKRRGGAVAKGVMMPLWRRSLNPRKSCSA